MAEAHSDTAAHDHVHGQMEISEQARTWATFKVLAKWSTFGVSVLLFFLILWFGVGTGLIGALAGAVIVGALGVLALKSKPAPAH